MRNFHLLLLTGLFSVYFSFGQVQNASQQPTVISGTVVDADTGVPIPGVQVFVQGTSTGTTTDFDGNYTLSVDDLGNKIEFRFVGYNSQEVVLSEGVTTFNINLAQDITQLEDVVVIGSRRLPRLVRDSAVPVDVFGPADLVSQTSTDVDEILRTQIPSFNVQRHGIDDEATLVRPITLRGLSPDNVVVLVNGKRRHRSASMALLGSSLNTGSQGADLNMIPSIALKQIEVLRDGAAAQYGADAVAGVFNMQLRDNTSGIQIRLQGGQYDGGNDAILRGVTESNGKLVEHDVSGVGRNVLAAVNAGFPLTENGFVNLSLEYRDANPTIRSGLRRDERTLISRGYPLNNPAQIWGSPDVSNSLISFLNAGIDLGANTHLYAFGGYGTRKSEGGFYFRAPGTGSARAGVFRVGDDARAVADLDQSDDTDCGAIVPSLEASFSEVMAFITQNKGKCFLFNELFPGGFTPRFGADIKDLSGTFGLRGGPDDGFRWDLSFAYGNSDIDYFIYNTVNASLGPDTPTSFKPRGYEQEELTVSASGNYPIDVRAFANPLNIAFGVEWHTEKFTTVAGDLDSYRVGNYGPQGFSVGSNGYQGLNPDFADSWDRPNFSLYLDLETDVTDKWTLGAAARYENYYNDFGSTLTWKVATLYRITDGFRLRGTASTGFRAPTPGQANLWALQTALSADGDQLVDTGQLPPTHPISASFGGEELTEETALSFTLGTIVDLSSDLTLTLDYFDISLDDRISLTGNITITPEIEKIMNEKNLLGGVENIKEVKFFSNDFDTHTQGIDLLLAYDSRSAAGHRTQASLAWNWTNTTLVNFSEPRNINTFLDQTLSEPFEIKLLTPRRQREIEDLNPKNRIVAMARHTRGAVNGMIRLNYFSSWSACRNNSNSCPMNIFDKFDSATIADAEIGVRLRDRYRLAFGVDNLFNTIPDAHPDETGSQGNIRPESTPWDYNGRSYVLRVLIDIF
ncbi:MAG: TonB-dependent receptor [Flavobacteriaceae bacterium]|nr:TonB-dependent receptor [Flavobacteriaceae bacterium]